MSIHVIDIRGASTGSYSNELEYLRAYDLQEQLRELVQKGFEIISVVSVPRRDNHCPSVDFWVIAKDKEEVRC